MSAVNRNSFATKLIRQFVGLVDIIYGAVFGEIDGLADRRVAVLLKGSLHSDVPFGGDVIGGFENFSDFFGDFGDFLDTAGF